MPRRSATAAKAVFACLADDTQLQLLDTLAAHGPATVSELSTRLPITRQAVAKHLAQLVNAGLLTTGPPEGRRLPYRLNPEPLHQATVWLSVLANRWDQRLDALRQHLEPANKGKPGP